jgi:poly(A) polymerase
LSILSKLSSWLKFKQKKSQQHYHLTPHIISRAEHTVSRANISKYALKVLYRLRESGFQAYLVGGGVRDVLLKRDPKDFDIATDAHPEQIQKLFQNCRLIGRRFRLAHIYFGGHIVEVATFRASSQDSQPVTSHFQHSKEGMILRDNIYGTLEEDVIRRDFTINALYYNIADFSIVDFVDGIKDLNACCLRMIGNAEQRYREDPVRMLRAIRFAAKLKFNIEKETEKPLCELGDLVKQVPSARLIDEYGKLFLSGFSKESFDLLRRYRLFEILFPQTEQCLEGEQKALAENFIRQVLQDTDVRVSEDKPVGLPFLLAAFLWYPLQEKMHHQLQTGLSEFSAFFEACDAVLSDQQKVVAISRRLSQAVREIWILQNRLEKRTPKRVVQMMLHPRFRAAYDFLLLRAKAGEKSIQALSVWWEKYVDASDEEQTLLRSTLKSNAKSRARRKKKKGVQ